jgi:hypothetical protein
MMAGCGLLSTLLKNRGKRDVIVERRRYRSVKNAEISSSEDYDSDDISSSPLDNKKKRKSHEAENASPYKRFSIRGEWELRVISFPFNLPIWFANLLMAASL